MRSRSEVVSILNSIAGYTDDEVTMNRDLIREVASEAAAHIEQARKIKEENRKLREKVRNVRRGG